MWVKPAFLILVEPIMIKVSLITVVLNSCNYIERTMKSVQRQDYRNIEYIVLDGGSVDGTIEIVNRNLDQVDIFRSERDKGISDAWNKGIEIASGDIIGLINAGDEYSPDSVTKAVEAIQAGADCIYGDTDLVDDNGKVISHNQGKFHPWFYSGGIGFYHPSCFATKALYNQIGGFDTNLLYAMDTDWILRATKAGGILRHAPVSVKMVSGGVSVINQFSAYGEHLQSLQKNGYGKSTAYLSMISTAVRGLSRILIKGA